MQTDFEIWQTNAAKMTVDSVLEQYNKPADFQIELKSLIEQQKRILSPEHPAHVMEAGCETGVTSLILDETSFNKVLLDYSPKVMQLNEKVKNVLNKNYDLCLGDMFAMPFEQNQFDIVFNAGVLEHYTLEQRTAALKEYARVLKPGGKIIIAVPNHYSLPYRFAYVVRNLLGKWHYPKEYKIFDLHKEAEKIGLIQEARHVLAKEAAFRWVSFLKGFSKIFRKLDRWFQFEGYLAVVILKKSSCQRSE